MERLKNVCAVIDMQGYLIGGKFFPREIAVCNKEVEISLEIDISLKRENISKFKDLINYRFQKYIVHGIPLESTRAKLGLKVQKSEKLEMVVTYLYNKVKTIEKGVLACKNNQVSEVLERLGIPHINLRHLPIEGEICPKMKELDMKIGKGLVWFCPLHTCLPTTREGRDKMRCALRKSQYIWVWIQSELIINEVVDILRPLKYI